MFNRKKKQPEVLVLQEHELVTVLKRWFILNDYLYIEVNTPGNFVKETALQVVYINECS